MKLLKKQAPLFAVGLLLVAGFGLIFKASSENPQVGEKLTTSQSNKRNIINSEKQSSPSRNIAQTTSPQENVEKNINWRKEKNSANRIELLATCYENEGACGFPTENPKDEYFAIGQALKKELKTLHHQALEGNIKSAELVRIGRRYLKIPDGHVKEAALHLLSTQETSLETLDEILKSVIGFHDANLIQLAMLELTRYIGQGQDQKIDQALLSALKNGSPLVGEEVAKNMAPFVNENNLKKYTSVLKQMSIGSLAYQNLKNVLDDYKRRQKSA